MFSLCLWRPWSTRKRSLWNTPKVSATPSKHTSKTESECDHYSINIIFLCSAPSNWGGSRLMLKSLSCQLIWYLFCLVLSLSPEVIFLHFLSCCPSACCLANSRRSLFGILSHNSCAHCPPLCQGGGERTTGQECLRWLGGSFVNQFCCGTLNDPLSFLLP